MSRQVLSASAALRDWAAREPDRVCLTFHGGGEAQPLTCRMLAEHASSYARLYRARGLRPGDPVVLLADSTAGFVAAFLGAQEASLLAVPCPPPEPLESGRRVAQRVGEILAKCRARALVTSVEGSIDAALTSTLTAAGVEVLGSSELATAPTSGSGEAQINDRHRFAYCQFTSGSGGIVKGVLLTHENLDANIRAMARAYELSRSDVAVTWLPLFHDMGLIAYVLMPLVIGYPGHVMSPTAFLTQPVSWLALMSRERATMAGAPNFAYGLCARRATDDDLVGLDLSAWRIACNGSEPVTRGAVEAFCERFAPYGFRASAMLPAYGLAEDTLCATSRGPGEGARFDEVSRETLERDGVARPSASGAAIASVGRPLPGHEIAIFGHDGRPVPDRHVGEVAIRGESVMSGYLPGTTGEVSVTQDGWLQTGDLGYLADSELYLVGRKKDLIIRAGRNYYPQDLEEPLARIPGLRPGRAVAFSVPGAEREQVLLAVERRKDAPENTTALKAAIREAVFVATRIVPDDILLLPPNTLPFTSSGKAMRPEVKRLYLEGRWASL
jgi:acyl-CoA synthetase (AMP-forming)/AMP-acid ligase II